MKIAVVGSKNLKLDISKYIPEETSTIISGGARGIDSLAEIYADNTNIPKLIIKPEYDKYGKAAPLKRNRAVTDCCAVLNRCPSGLLRGSSLEIGGI